MRNLWQGFSEEHSWIKPRPPQTVYGILKYRGNRPRGCYGTVNYGTINCWSIVERALSTFAKSVAEKIVQLRDRVDLVDRPCEFVADSMKLDRIAVQCDV